ncbi:MAG: capsular biosynthesis protein CpsI [Hoeflea sp. BRH_c9]|nr:MAG: capsular biosynthesis protein CpsI [Hoeflea sp. BRH_c9]
MKILVTGNAGFIGFHVAQRLIKRGDDVTGIDNVNEYYDPELKEARLTAIQKLAAVSAGSYRFVRAGLEDKAAVDALFAGQRYDRVIHLAAQAGVRYSLEKPQSYVESNIVAFTNLLEACRHTEVPHLTYASTSSVYGANTSMPFSEHSGADHPLQFYAATKRANELMAHSYSHLFGLPTTGLRFFTVYGPWGRPDMALFKFTKLVLEGKPIPVFNHGNHTRDFTYVDDIVEGVIKASDDIARPNPDWNSKRPDPATSSAPFRLFNIGNGKPEKLLTYIEAIETALGKKAIMEMLPMQAGDAPDTFADTSELTRQLNYAPSTNIAVGVKKFVDWYRSYYQI